MNATQPRNRLLALLIIGLLALGGAFAGVTLRPEPPRPTALPASTPPAAREAVRNATSLSDAFITIADAVTSSVVRIEVERSPSQEGSGVPAGLRELFEGPDGLAPEGAVPQVLGGSGFLVTSDGYILTNNHVVADADRIMVTLRDKRVLEAEIVGTDPSTDIAVIRVDAADLPVVALGNSDDARVGEWVLAIGNPGFANESPLDFTVTSGIISAKGRPLNILGAELMSADPLAAQYAIEDFIQTDAVINPGNSGGPLVDLRGTVIGINTAIASSTGYSQGYGFAIPSNLARRVMRDLIEYGYVRRPLLGISIADVTPEDAEVYGLPAIAGVVVEDFAPESPAEQSGLKRHDVIVAVSGTAVDRVGQLQRLVALQEPGDTVPLDVIRYGASLKLRVPLMEAEGAGRLPQRQPPRITAGLGLELEELTPQLARQLGYDETAGVLVAGVAPASPAARRNIGRDHRVVSIDRTPVASLAEARSLLRQARSGEVVSLLMEYPDGRTYIANVRMP
ncbi:MAG TPA: trypsin-like peptidase domain-containing protein [Longimicrobiales bacterium]|nr:trypsin-like peptidase domain-containing protein [Longimicrobiales bacterium]